MANKSLILLLLSISMRLVWKFCSVIKFPLADKIGTFERMEYIDIIQTTKCIFSTFAARRIIFAIADQFEVDK